ncbi:hydrogenase maturation nickel metallochaperone HypA [Propionicimonas sp.]|uniref:hydrogenase maturation nickel metallochaperone HypA n=1 Tax=Propionicimonas sp. TaxID=1955623 RepID=UPI00179049EC|nr:hydrogenase maturation nickel metallochaperone HypA [Propionicimonas sp.]MBU3975336.1 hydrogenase maturation nickel metallochaperone HypA [Actinomycetota bacterium]MBA3020258.1 hydrogenase maturation nickel metallochaperone HypA [Propionicimonas sp.]MBU3986515.1 hydrogenase maturation nickel metallochaperone HypA [Actinomycetota bacterium]MBU4008084.1 hydrogenase maturation nickel metallochaperone HypA [Actinomycetota bacterium]MBU4064342.1 hydrogenase maturation nickel metallochaperone Hyp
MHELSLCNSIARAVIQNAQGRRVTSVRLRVGALRQVVPETLVYCWSIASRGPILDGSVLEVEHVPAEIECGDCGTRSELSRFNLSCPSCGNHEVKVVSGEEMLIESIEVADEAEPPEAPPDPRPSGPATTAAH